MKREMATAKIDLVQGVDSHIDSLINDLGNVLAIDSTDLSNTDVMFAYDLHQKLIRHELLTVVTSHLKKIFDKSKASLDDTLIEMGKSNEAVPGTTTLMYENESFIFQKKMNRAGEQLTAKDLLTSLNRLGVTPETIKKATKMATTEKRGNIYYQIECND